MLTVIEKKKKKEQRKYKIIIYIFITKSDVPNV